MGPGAGRRLLILIAAITGLAGLVMPVDARAVSVCVADFQNGTRYSSFDPLPDNLAFYLTGFPDIKVIERWKVRGDVSSSAELDKMAQRARSFGADVLVEGAVKEDTGKLVATIHAYDLTQSARDAFELSVVDAGNCREAAEKASSVLRQHFSEMSGSRASVWLSAPERGPDPMPCVAPAGLQAEQQALAERGLRRAKALAAKVEAPVSGSDLVSQADFARMIARLAAHMSADYRTVFTADDPSAPVSRTRAVAALSKGLGVDEHLGAGGGSENLSRSALADLMMRYLPPAPGTAGTADVAKPTGLVIDARGLGYERSMSPVVECEDGTRVYPDRKHLPSIDYIQDQGIASFVHDLGSAPRAGERPLAVRAIGVKGTASQIAVVSQADAERIRSAAKDSDFISEWKVTFIVDEGY